MDKETLEVNVKIPLEPKVVNISKILKLNGVSSISDNVYSGEQREKVNKFLEDYFKALIEPIKTFDGIVFQKDKKVILLMGSAYIQVVTDNNEGAWCWESLDLDEYFVLSDIETKGLIQVLKQKLREMCRTKPETMVNYYYFCLKHGIKPEFSGYSGDNETILKEQLEQRIRSDIDASANQYYEEGFESNYMAKNWDDRFKEELFYDMLDDAREKYEGTEEQKEDLKYAIEEITNKWLEYSGDPITREIVDKIRA